MAKGFERFFHRLPALLGTAYVGGDKKRLAPALTNFDDDCAAPVFIASGDDDFRSFPRKEDSGSLADAGGPAGNESNLIVQTHAAEFSANAAFYARSRLD